MPAVIIFRAFTAPLFYTKRHMVEAGLIRVPAVV
jgi:hypothetical protein